MINKIKTIDELTDIVSQLHREGKIVVSTGGCFDIIHAGHIYYLEEASKLGDCFIVFLNSDVSVRGVKGDKRPIVTEQDRAEVIAALEAVDYVCLFDESTPCEIIENVKPDLFIKGGDYRGKHIPEMDVLGQYGGKVEYLDFKDGRSTTDIIEKILDTYIGE